MLKYLDMITIAVPPALPACLTVATAIAVSRLQTHDIFVSNPSAVALAGHMDVLCFDKTGTLTEPGLDLQVRGAVGGCKGGRGAENGGLNSQPDQSSRPFCSRISQPCYSPATPPSSTTRRALFRCCRMALALPPSAPERRCPHAPSRSCWPPATAWRSWGRSWWATRWTSASMRPRVCACGCAGAPVGVWAGWAAGRAWRRAGQLGCRGWLLLCARLCACQPPSA